ncbi:MAG: hypothetical protein RR054_06435 [Clostridia bacterium]
MKKFRVLILILLAVTLMLCLVGCGEEMYNKKDYVYVIVRQNSKTINTQVVKIGEKANVPVGLEAKNIHVSTSEESELFDFSKPITKRVTIYYVVPAK